MLLMIAVVKIPNLSREGFRGTENTAGLLALGVKPTHHAFPSEQNEQWLTDCNHQV